MLQTFNATKDALLGFAPWIPGESQFGLQSLSAEEIGAALAKGVKGAKVNDLKIEMDSRGTTDRARLVLDWNAPGKRARLPSTAFAKGTSTNLGSRIVVSAFGCHTYETRFYQQIYPTIPDLTVRPIVARSGQGGRYVIAFEDLKLRGDVTFFNADSEAPKLHAEGVVELLAKIHGRFWRSPRFNTDLKWLETYSRRPGYPFMKWMFKWSDLKYVQPHPTLPESIKRLTKDYVNHQDKFTKIWEAMPPTLCHGDCHLGNTFANPDRSAGIYDWQVFHKMNGLRDFAYFMMHSVPTELRRAEEKELLRRYLDELARNGAGKEAPSFDEAWEAYRLLTIDGWIIIAFTFAVGGMQPDDRMEVTAKRAIATMLDLDLAQKIDQVVRG